MKRRQTLASLVAWVAVCAQSGALAQPRLPLIVVLMHGRESALPGRLEALVEGLRERGYLEGQSYRLEVRWSDNHVDRLPALARELLAKQPDVAVCSPVLSAQALHRESKTVPIVMASGAGALRLGLIASLARPGGNVTGIHNQLDELAAKQLEFLREIAPNAKRVMTLSSGLGAAEPDVRQGSRAAATAYGMTLIEAWADMPAKLAQVSALCERERCEGLVVLLDPSVQSFRAEVITMAAKLRIPAVYPTLEYADDGGLLAYSTDARALRMMTGVGSSRSMRSATIWLDTASPRLQSTSTTSGRAAAACTSRRPESPTTSTTWILCSERNRDSA